MARSSARSRRAGADADGAGGLRLRRDRGLRRDRQREREPERRTPAGGALQADVAAHQGDELPGDGEPEPRAAEFAPDRAVGLAEAPEQAVLPNFSDADARIDDGEAQP